eukprot:s39_g22.t1
METWRPTVARHGAVPTTATTSTTSRWDGCNSAWAWSANGREEEQWVAGGGEIGMTETGNEGHGDPWWEQQVADPWSSKTNSDGGSGDGVRKVANHAYDGWLDDFHMRQFNVAQAERTTALSHGRWQGEQVEHGIGVDLRRRVGRGQAGVRERVSYYLQWVQTRFMEVEVSKVAQLMSDLFRRGRRRHDQPVRDFNVEFERMVLRLTEIQCHVPPLIKAWLYLDKLRLSEAEELALLSSVNNEYDCKKLQHAALVQDRAIRRPGSWGGEDSRGGSGGNGKRWARQSVHMTVHEGEEVSSDDEQADEVLDDGEILDEGTAQEHYMAYMTYQGAKAKYKEVLKGRGVDPQAAEKRNQERLRLAKQRSYCSACKRRGHWHKDPECPLRQKPSSGSTSGQSRYSL